MLRLGGSICKDSALVRSANFLLFRGRMTGKPFIIVLQEESPLTHPVRDVRCLVLGR